MTTMQAVKAAAAKLKHETGEDGTNDGEHDAALELLGALGTLFAEEGRKLARHDSYLAERFPGTAQGDSLERAARTMSEEQARELHQLANHVISGLRVGMPDSGMIRRDILKEDETRAYDLSRAVLLVLAPWVLARRPARGGR